VDRLAGTSIVMHVHALTSPAAAGSPPIRIDRRRLLVGGAALAGLTLAARSVPLISGAVSSGSGPTGALSAASFTPHIGTVFRVRGDGVGALSLRLVEVTATHGHRSEPTLLSGSAFTLIFEGPAASPLPSADYQLRHDVLDLPPMYVSPVGLTSRVQDYQIIVDTRVFDSSTASRKAG
jgi:hypothetical protein